MLQIELTARTSQWPFSQKERLSVYPLASPRQHDLPGATVAMLPTLKLAECNFHLNSGPDSHEFGFLHFKRNLCHSQFPTVVARFFLDIIPHGQWTRNHVRLNNLLHNWARQAGTLSQDFVSHRAPKCLGVGSLNVKICIRGSWARHGSIWTLTSTCLRDSEMERWKWLEMSPNHMFSFALFELQTKRFNILSLELFAAEFLSYRHSGSTNSGRRRNSTYSTYVNSKGVLSVLGCYGWCCGVEQGACPSVF